MRIEVLVESEDPKIYPLNKAKIVIGSSENCDVILSSDSISRKHLVIIVEKEHFYVVDQGSSNGTYLNEERLVPGRKTEFTSFFPLRLGSSVLITLLSDEEGNDSQLIQFPIRDENTPAASRAEEKTSMLSIKDLQAPKTDKLIKKRQEYKTKKNSESKDLKGGSTGKKKGSADIEKGQSNFFKIFALLILSAAVVYQYFVKQEEVPLQSVEEVVKEQLPKEVAKEVEKKSPLLIDDSDLASVTALKNALMDIKCSTPLEVHLCDLIPGAKEGKWGVVQVGTMVYILLDGKKYFDLGGQYFSQRSTRTSPRKKETDVESSQNGPKQTIAAYFIVEGIPTGIDYTLFGQTNITIALFLDGDEEADLVIAIRPEALNKLKQSLQLAHLELSKNEGIQKLDFLKSYYILY